MDDDRSRFLSPPRRRLPRSEDYGGDDGFAADGQAPPRLKQ